MANWVLYDNFRLKQINGNALNLAAGGATIKCALITSAVAPVTATDTAWGSYTEVSGTNYTAGGIDISTSQSVALATGTVKYTTSVTIKWLQHVSGFNNARYAVLYDSVSNKLVGYGDLGSNVGNVSGDLQITIDANGIFTSP